MRNPPTKGLEWRWIQDELDDLESKKLTKLTYRKALARLVELEKWFAATLAGPEWFVVFNTANKRSTVRQRLSRIRWRYDKYEQEHEWTTTS